MYASSDPRALGIGRLFATRAVEREVWVMAAILAMAFLDTTGWEKFAVFH
jgi:hypothetical protein